MIFIHTQPDFIKKMEDERKSKTQIKNEVKALQKIGEQLVDLSADQIDSIDLPEALSAAIKDARQISRHEARRRQMQYIGKLMRKIDPEPILNALRNIRQGDYQKALAFKKIEKWRDELVNGKIEIIDEIIAKCPAARRQRLSQLARNARNTEGSAKASKASKALFRYLREIYENQAI